MPYIGNPAVVGDSANTFKTLDDIASFTVTFDATDSSVVSIANNTLTFNNHRFVTGQKVTYNDGGGTAIGGLSDGSYFIIKEDQSTIKLASSASNAASGTAIDLTSGAAGGSHTLNIAFDGVNTKFKATHTNGIKAKISRPAQITLSINGVVQQPTADYSIESDSTIAFSSAPVATDKIFGSFIGEVAASFDLSDNTVDEFTANGSLTTFTLSKTVPSNNDLLVTLDGVTQYPNTQSATRAYSVLENVLTFTSAPAAGVIIQVRHIGFSGASSQSVTGFYGRTGNVQLKNTDNVAINDLTAADGTFSGNVTIGGTLGIGGTLTYEDVTNVDSVGLITARNGIVVGSGITLSKDGDIFTTGVSTFSGEVSVNDTLNITGNLNIADKIIHTGDTNTSIRFPSPDEVTVETSGTERLAIEPAGNVNITQNVKVAGVVTATSFSGSGANLTGIAATDNVRTGILDVAGIATFRSDVLVGSAVTLSESGIAVAGAAVTASNFNGGQLGRRNLLINGNFMIAQRGTSSTTMNDYFVDRWRTFGGPSGFTISRQDDLTYPDGKYGIRMHRTSGNSQTNNHGVGQGVETKTSKIIAGKTVTLSFKARRGANFSASSNQLSAAINGGEGTDENPFGMTNTNGASVLCTLAETFTSHELSFDVPSDKTQLTVMFSYTPSGTAGSNDWFEIADCQLEVGEKTPFEILSEAEQLLLCQRYYEGIIMGTGTALMRTYTSTTNVTNVEYNYKVEKRASPTWSLEGNGTWYPSGSSGMNAYPSTSTCIFQRNDETAQYLTDANGDLCGSFSAEL